MTMQRLKKAWLILTLMPAPFLFHFYEYGQYVKREEASYLLLASVLFVIVTGGLSGLIKLRFIFLANLLTAVISLLLAKNFIFDDGGWFKPFGRDIVILLTAFVLFIGQLLIRAVAKLLIDR
ncbi:hypothetical protein SporoP37_08980 [Sporosarcina sp. P37]|uniref:hypothetical protein n=1 Tax=unclassified Sporosarcina TaxID=2647733 RepID=UPI000A17A1BD|nr:MULTISPECIES: hypothetical protein [unclassified Sporosarcina]ARK24784.1 hypothetical protein SporoP37_08980 [Sporosarcina sp. P37]PID19942.1 hypothetical protein CSV62_01515 [Sporosarcina sp. P35]